MGFSDKLVQSHINRLEEELIDLERQSIHRSWFQEDTIDHWRHNRMYEPVFKCLSHTKNDLWLSIGDGRYGLDSIKMQRRGWKNVFPTDVAVALLEQSKELGLINDYGLENAESLSFADNSFDYVLCKESLHHMARPYLALYEMVRVARLAAVIIEPQCQIIDLPVIENAKPLYEDDGNYVYGISKSELTKLALGLNLPAIATKGLVDFYLEGYEFEPAQKDSAPFVEFQLNVMKQEARVKNKQSKYGMILGIIFMAPPESGVREILSNNDWNLEEFDPNPHL